MFFSNPGIEAEILSVLHLNWKSAHSYAAGRDYCALSYRVQGGADFTHNETKSHISAEDIVYVPAGLDYRIDAEKEELFVIHFNMNGLQETELDIFTPSSANYFEQKFNDIYKSWSQKKPGYLYDCKAAFYKILEHIAKQKTETQSDSIASGLNDAAEYIHEHYSDKTLTVNFLAQRANMSDTYFRKLFVKQFSETPLKYINSLRIERSLELLMSGYYSVSEIAEKCGFDSQNYFSNVFKKFTGKTPSQYKKRSD